MFKNQVQPEFPSFYWKVDLNLELLFFNTEWEKKIFDKTMASWLDQIHEDEKSDLMSAIDSSKLLKKHFSMEFRLRNPDQHWIWVHGRFQPFFDDMQCVRGFDIFGIEFELQNQSSKSNVSRLLAAEDASRVKSGFLANMSHEIRAPIQAIVGYAHMLADLELSPEERKKMSRAMSRSGDFLLQLVKDILDFSKIEAGRMDIDIHPVSPWYTISEVFETFGLQANKKGIKLVAFTEGVIPVLFHTDPTRLRQILVNLIGNAIKYTLKGDIKVRIKIDHVEDIPGDCLVFSVEDRGPGMDENQMASLFNPFVRAGKGFSSRVEGTGLGLTIANRLAGLLGGFIKVTTKLKAGSCFSLYLPIDEKDLHKVVDSERLGTLNSRDLNAITSTLSLPSSASILLAEDSEDIQVYLRYLLEKEGLDVTTVSSGSKVLQELSQSDFDLILMDLQMPDGGGMETTKIIRNSGNKIPIFALTANATKQDEIECLEAGFDLFLTKPIDREKLLEALACFLPIAEKSKVEVLEGATNSDSNFNLQQHFFNSLVIKINNIIDFNNSKSFDSLEKELHQLKGASGFYGYPQLAQIAEKIECALKTASNEKEIEDLIKVLSVEINKIIA
ncbi:MAG: PAS domain-containing hybrid sensor histidine kinase/response regulator [Planctomycetes bacterium]|nr:PAS domain-containing hybrid sensor histidine kinase/response regulator [Planctomycetota bacterium]